MNEELPGLNHSPLPLFSLVSALILAVVLVGTGWVFYKSYRLDASLAAVEKGLKSSQDQLDELKAEHLDSLVVAQETVKEVEASIVWSQVVQQLLKTTPVNIFYRSYSASNDGKMSVSVVTDSYTSAANLISVLNQSKVFSNAFVASLARGSSDAGSSVVTFGITFNIDSSNL